MKIYSASKNLLFNAGTLSLDSIWRFQFMTTSNLLKIEKKSTTGNTSHVGRCKVENPKPVILKALSHS